MATLTWQDVAGQIRAPDYTDVGAQITKGIEGLGNAVAKIGAAPAEREQARIASQMALTATGMKFQEANDIKAEKAFDKAKKLQDETDLKEFSTIRSSFETGAREAALKGIGYDAYLAGNKAYQELSPGAKAHADGFGNDSYFQGIQLHDQRAAEAQNNRIQEAQLALQQQAASEARLARAQAAKSQRINDQLAQGKLDDYLKEKADKKFLSTPLGKLTIRVGTNYNDATGRAYENKSWGELAKASGVKDFSEYSESFSNFNATRVKQGKRPIPEGAAKAMLATQVGKNGGVPGWVNEIDQGDIDQRFGLLADQYDFSLNEADVLVKYQKLADAGATFSDEQVLADLQRVNAPKEVKTPPAASGQPMSNMDLWKMTHK